MTQADFQEKIKNGLINQGLVEHILEADNSLLVNCTDKSNFLINILSSKYTFLHDNDDEIENYLLTHTNAEFTLDLIKITEEYPAFFLYFMLITKLREEKIIDKGLFYHIMDNIVVREDEFEEFIIKLLSHYKFKDV